MRYLLILLITFSFVAKSQDASQCKNVTDWIYRDLTLNSLGKSYDIVKKKIMLSILVSQENTKSENLNRHKELISHYKTLLENGNEFSALAEDYRPLKRYRWWRRRKYSRAKTLTLKEAIHSWKELQEENKSYFNGLEKKYLLNEWDMFIIKAIEQLKSISVEDDKLQKSLNSILEHIDRKESYTLSQSDITELKEQIEQDKTKVISSSQEAYKKVLSELGSLCSNEEIAILQGQCELVQKSSANNLFLGLAELSHIIQVTALNAEKPTLPEKPKEEEIKDQENNPDEVDLLSIEKPIYETNQSKGATYCKRSEELLRSITVHHTATYFGDTPERVNESHLGRSTRGDLWYMIGYHYLISDVIGQNPVVSEGRPLNYQGAHAEGVTPKLSKAEYNEMKKYTVTCASSEEEHANKTPVSIAKKFPKKRTPRANQTSVGITLLGNYEAEYKIDVSGVRLIKNYNPDYRGPSDSSLEKFAQLACKLQRQYPKITTLYPHSYFTETNCPGGAIIHMKTIAQKATKYGCQFKVVYKK